MDESYIFVINRASKAQDFVHKYGLDRDPDHIGNKIKYKPFSEIILQSRSIWTQT